MESKRLDIKVNDQFKVGRERGKELILQGSILVNGKVVKKPSTKVLEEDILTIDKYVEAKKFVSRGGYKLEKALEVFNINLDEKNCLDVGASTGGFTHCMLNNNCKIVYSVDTGTGQLHESIVNDSRVVNMEKTNIVNVKKEEIANEFDFITVDVSFVSIGKIIPFLRKFLKDGGEGVFLIKPQFEAGKQYLNKKGVVKNMKVHNMVVTNIKNICINNGFQCIDLIQSPIQGHEGNIEYLLYVRGV